MFAPLFTLLLLFVVIETKALSDCVVVYVVNKPGDTVATAGTSIRFDDQFLETYTVDSELVNNLMKVFVCAEIKSIDTDYEEKHHDEIDRWIVHDCMDRKCYVVSALEYTYRTHTDPFLFRDKRKPQVAKALQTDPPTRSEVCELRTERDCNDDRCKHFGMMYGCRSKTFCGFETEIACRSQAHCKYNRRCLPNTFNN